MTKAAVVGAAVVVAIVQVTMHPDMTPGLAGLAVMAVVAGWVIAPAGRETAHAAWLFVAPLAPAVLHAFSGREGPVLELVWMAGLTASLVRTVSWSAWAIPPSWRPLAGGWGLVLALSWPVLVAREADFTRAGLFDVGAVNAWGAPPMTAPHAVAWVLVVVWTHLLGLLWLDWATGRFAEAAGARDEAGSTPTVVWALGAGTTIASLVAIYQGLVDMTFASTPFWAGISRAPGTLLDANGYGVCAALVAPMALVVVRSRLLGVGLFVVNLLGMWMSASRTAAVCVIVGTAAVAIAFWREQPASRRRSVLVPTIAVATVAAVVLLGLAIGPARRLLERPNTDRGESVVSAVLNRGAYGLTATRIMRDYPTTGVGIGGYQLIAPAYWREINNSALDFDSAQNWWRHEAAELGVVGGASLFAWSIALAWRVLAGRSRVGRAFAATSVRGLLVAIGVASIVQTPTLAPVVLLGFMLLVAWLAAVVEPRAVGPVSHGWMRMAWVVAVACAVAYVVGHARLSRGPLSVAARAERAGQAHIAGTYGEEVDAEASRFHWTRGDARFSWPARTRWLLLELWAHHPDIAQNPVRVRLATACETVFDETIPSPQAIGIGLTIPDGQRRVDLRVHVSRTWRPVDSGGTDTREFGVGIASDFVEAPEGVSSQARVVTLRSCEP